MRAIRRAGFSRGDFGIEHRADDPVIGARAGTNGDRVETILRGEGVARIRTAQAGADDSPIRGAAGEEIVDDDRLVRAVERADSEMNDAGRDARSGHRPGGGSAPGSRSRLAFERRKSPPFGLEPGIFVVSLDMVGSIRQSLVNW